MRYTRNRQLKKANEDYFHELIKKNFPIGVIKIGLDPTFEWHRDYNNVSIQDGDKILFIDLYEVDFCYY